MMEKAAVCEECGVPQPFYLQNKWLSNGDIVQAANPNVRLGFTECETVDPLIRNVGKIIGMPIEEQVINITYRGTKLYLDQIVPEEIQKALREQTIDEGPFRDNMMALCHFVGFGKYEFVDARHENDPDDYSKTRIQRPFSLPEAAGAYAGAIAVFAGGEHSVTYEEVAPDLWEFTSRWTEYPDIMREILTIEARYEPRDGDLELERCQTCGGPKALSEYQWFQEDGLIVNKNTKRRMVLLGPELTDSLFEALEYELGEEIPGVIVEAQRRVIRSGVFPVAELTEGEEMRTQLALRGLGNLREFKVNPKGVQMRIDNASGYYTTIGLIQGVFELMFDIEASVSWEITKENSLLLEVTPLSTFTPTYA
jgi:hypothetical protein